MRERLQKWRRERRKSRAAVLRTRDTRRSSSASEDEVGGFQARCASGSRNGRTRSAGNKPLFGFAQQLPHLLKRRVGIWQDQIGVLE